MVFWCLQFPPKNKRKPVNLSYHSNKVEFLRSFFGGNQRHQKPFRNYLTFRKTWNTVKIGCVCITNFKAHFSGLRYFIWGVIYLWWKTLRPISRAFQTLKLFSVRQPMWRGTVIGLNQSSLELYNPKLPQCDSPGSWIFFQEQVFTQPCHKQKITRKKNI